MENQNEKLCSRCIHRPVCMARMMVDDVIKTWNSQYPHVKMQENGDKLAENCTEYQTLSSIHVIEKEHEEDKDFHQSDIFEKGK